MKRIKLLFDGGAVGDIAGSCFVLTVGDQVFVIDAGMKQRRNYEQLVKDNAHFPFEVKKVTAVVLTHAHSDHNGLLARMVRCGYRGPILCTEDTAEISDIMLRNSAGIIEGMEKEWRQSQEKRRERRGGRRNQGRSLREPLFTREDVERVKRSYSYLGYLSWLTIGEGVWVKLYPSAHVIGGAICVIKIRLSSRKMLHLGFSGDLGRDDNLLLQKPMEVKEPLDYWISESTYGDRYHPSRVGEETRLRDAIGDIYQQNGKIIFPTFAFSRTQELIYLLSRWMNEGEVPEMPIYLDSPLGMEITEKFGWAWEKRAFACNNLPFNPFREGANSHLRLVLTVEESERLVAKEGPYCVLAGSGMCDHGRVRYHLKAGLPDSKVKVCLTGFMMENTLGRKIKDASRGSRIKIDGGFVDIEADIISLDFSAHADARLLIDYARRLHEQHPLKRIFLVHGEKEAARAMSQSLVGTLGLPLHQVIIPELDQSFSLN